MTPGAWAVLVAAIVVVLLYESGKDDSTSSSAAGGTSSPASGGTGDILQDLLSGITKAEGVASVHNNPGGICGSYDSNGNCLGPKTFDTLDDGITAAENLITKYLDNDAITLEQFVQKWTGLNSGQVYNNYLSTLSGATGLSPTDTLNGSPDDTSTLYDD